MYASELVNLRGVLKEKSLRGMSYIICTVYVRMFFHITLPVTWILNSHVSMLLVEVYVCCLIGLVCST